MGQLTFGMWLGLLLAQLGLFETVQASVARLVPLVGFTLGSAAFVYMRHCTVPRAGLALVGWLAGVALAPPEGELVLGRVHIDAVVTRRSFLGDDPTCTLRPIGSVVEVRARRCQLKPGSEVRIHGELRAPVPAYDSRVFAEGEYEGAAFWRQLFNRVQGELDLGSAQVRVWREPPAWRNALGASRERVSSLLNQQLSERAATIAHALLLGEALQLPRAERQALAMLGLMHLFAISGLHFALVAGTLAWLLQHLCAWFSPWLPGRDTGRVAATVSSVTLAPLALFVGATPSSVRAALFLALLWFGRACCGRKVAPLRALCLTVLGTLLVAPRMAYSVGFLLSVTATLALLTAPQSRLPSALRALALSTRVTLMTLPVTWGYFGQPALAGIVVNAVLAGPLAIVLVLGALASAMSVRLPWDLGQHVGPLYSRLVDQLLSGLMGLAPYAERLTPRRLSAPEACVLVAIIVGALVLRGRYRWLLAAGLALGGWLRLHP